ncbi:ACP phosphodiesterase [Sediminibacterium goheungense]|uniref:Acyl carrier protein phosphodiesterase n=1 Tax=Sediminibacterium goheungense TaxID=1086393 RepID=A0A4R6J1H7_9BACT|nr:ACP phosphodiesterase [Sediminibacterium goheungense]TDO29100.1 acyl carrier protein phosphodiesterase [Sediminibacterium goheungense]
MNYLAHAYLSFHDPQVLVGNMISDFVKGKKQYDYPEGIQKGIKLHRMIDLFTDQHGATKRAKELLKPAVGPYAGAFIDVVYDHFLATDPDIHDADTWMEFSATTYRLLEPQMHHFPEKFARMFPYMKTQNWLYNYRFNWGIERSFEGVARRASYLSPENDAFQLFELHYDQLKASYSQFFPEVKKLALDLLHDQ